MDGRGPHPGGVRGADVPPRRIPGGQPPSRSGSTTRRWPSAVAAWVSTSRHRRCRMCTPAVAETVPSARRAATANNANLLAMGSLPHRPSPRDGDGGCLPGVLARRRLRESGNGFYEYHLIGYDEVEDFRLPGVQGERLRGPASPFGASRPRAPRPWLTDQRGCPMSSTDPPVHVVAVDLGATRRSRDARPRRARDPRAARGLPHAQSGLAAPDGVLRWNVLGLVGGHPGWTGAWRDGWRTSAPSASISWGVDYGLQRNGRLLSRPRALPGIRGTNVRWMRCTAGCRMRTNTHGPYAVHGHQSPSTSSPPIRRCSRSRMLVLPIPSLFSGWLGGAPAAERTIAFDDGHARPRRRVGSPRRSPRSPSSARLLPPVVSARDGRGTRDESGSRMPQGSAPALMWSRSAAHDTASAVLATPLEGSAAFISCGSWGPGGRGRARRRSSPRDARRAGITNEAAVGGEYLVYRNTMGLWLLSEAQRSWRRTGAELSVEELVALASAVPEGLPTVDLDDPALQRRRRRRGTDRRVVWPPRDPLSTRPGRGDAMPAGVSGQRLRRGGVDDRPAGIPPDRGDPHRRRGRAQRPALPAPGRPLRTARPRRTGRGHCDRQCAGPGDERGCHRRLGAGDCARSCAARTPRPSISREPLPYTRPKELREHQIRPRPRQR